jgi:hypothetical protein
LRSTKKTYNKKTQIKCLQLPTAKLLHDSSDKHLHNTYRIEVFRELAEEVQIEILGHLQKKQQLAHDIA